jgi:hypothetical protein
MKIAKINPIHTKGRKNDMSTYRPILILPVFSKILQKIVYNRLVAFVKKKHNILSQNQRGFWENRSTETACQNFVEFIQKKLDNGQHVIGTFFDLSKAYDVINHEILLNKLDYYGIRRKTKLWLESYLSYRSQYVEILAKTEDICNQNYKSTCKAIK